MTLDNMRHDRTYRSCRKCEWGVYKEMSLQDDWDGTLTCHKCGDKIRRFGSEDLFEN